MPSFLSKRGGMPGPLSNVPSWPVRGALSMGASDRFDDPKIQLSEGIREIREALKALREGVVSSVKSRNLLQDMVAQQEQQIADFETKAALAEKLNDPKLAEELRNERKKREAELETLRLRLTQAEAKAESAKIQLPEEEARLLQQANDLKAQFARLTGARAERGSLGFGSDTEETWNRMQEKARDLEREAAAREEVAAARAGQATGPAYTPRIAPKSADQSAEEMLTAMEAR